MGASRHPEKLIKLSGWKKPARWRWAPAEHWICPIKPHFVEDIRPQIRASDNAKHPASSKRWGFHEPGWRDRGV